MTASPDPYVVLTNVHHAFARTPVLHDISFEAYPGQVLGIIGPNGAGKSTTMRILTGYLAPASGSVTVCGHAMTPHAVQARQAIGYLPEGAPLWDEWQVTAFLKSIGSIRGLHGARLRERLETVIEEAAIGSVATRRIETLSKGFRRRVALAAALIGDPEVLVLDEPTDGLDPNQKHDMRALIRRLAKDKAILISTHILEEIPAVCERVIAIVEGRIVLSTTPEEFGKGESLDVAFRKLTSQVAVSE